MPLQGRPSGRSARVRRRGRAIEDATRLRLVSISPGSVAATLELPDVASDEVGLDLDDARLGEVATLSSLEVLRGDHLTGDEERIAEAWTALADDVGIGTRVERVVISLRSEQTLGQSRTAVLDETTATRLRLWVESQATARRDDRVQGTLMEADFERRTARLRTPQGHSIIVAFSDALADDIQKALRRPSEVEGLVEYDTDASTVRSIELRRIVRAEQLIMGLASEAFWQTRPVEELAQEQGVRPLSDPSVLYDAEATDDEVAAYFAALDS